MSEQTFFSKLTIEEGFARYNGMVVYILIPIFISRPVLAVLQKLFWFLCQAQLTHLSLGKATIWALKLSVHQLQLLWVEEISESPV
jgi:hypothetical protein